MQRPVVLAAAFAAGFALALAAPATASADCASTCGDVCYAPQASTLFRARVVAAMGGYSPRVQLVERLGGSAEVTAAVGDEIESVYAETQVAIGDELVLLLASFDDGSGSGYYQWNTAWRIEGVDVVCSTIDRTVPLEQYVAMATSSECEEIAVDLEIDNRCDDTVEGCAATGAPSLLAALAVLGLGARRRVRDGRSRRQRPRA